MRRACLLAGVRREACVLCVSSVQAASSCFPGLHPLHLETQAGAARERRVRPRHGIASLSTSWPLTSSHLPLTLFRLGRHIQKSAWSLLTLISISPSLCLCSPLCRLQGHFPRGRSLCHGCSHEDKFPPGIVCAAVAHSPKAKASRVFFPARKKTTQWLALMCRSSIKVLCFLGLCVFWSHQFFQPCPSIP